MHLLKQFGLGGQLNQGFLLANCLWGAIAGGYMLYGWRQSSLIAFIGGLAMTAVSFFVVNAWLMSAASVLIMLAVWWLARQGY